FQYTAHDEKGKEVTGKLTARDRDQATELLRKRGYTAPLIKSAQATGGKKEIKLPGSGKVKPKALVVFTRQFATMISAGVPMLRALTTLREQTSSPALKLALEKVTADVQGGASLSESL